MIVWPGRLAGSGRVGPEASCAGTRPLSRPCGRSGNGRFSIPQVVAHDWSWRGRLPHRRRPMPVPGGWVMKRLLPARLLAALWREAETPREPPDDIVRASRRRVRVAAMLGTLAYSVLLGLELSGAVPAPVLEHRIDVTHDVAG